MTPGNNGASTPEEDDPFGYLYADGQANGAVPPSGGGGYGYPGSVNRVRAVGERQYGQQQPGYGQQAAQTTPYGQQVPQQPQAYGQQAYGQPNAQYAAPETFPGGADTTRQAPVGDGGGGRGRGPNTKGLLIGAIAVVAAVVIGIGVAMIGGDDDDKGGNQAGASPSVSQSAEPSQSSTTAAADDQAELPKSDAKALKLTGTVTASDIVGAKADGGIYVTNFNQVGASVTWTPSGIPKDGKYTLYVGYGVPGKDMSSTLSINGAAQGRKINMANFAHGPEGDYEKGWTSTWSNIQLNKGTNEIKISCEQGDTCDFNLDQVWLIKGWKK